MNQTRERLLSRAFVSLTDSLVEDYVIDLLGRLVGYSAGLLAPRKPG
jgi:hypothetical protein